MVAHTRLPSLEDLPPQRRSTTVAALRRGQIKISEPVPLENSGPSPVWKSPTAATFPNDSLTGFGTVDGVAPHQQAVAEINDPPVRAESRQTPSSTDLRPDPYIPPKTSHGVPLKHQRSSGFLDVTDGGLSISGASSQPRSSENGSVSDFTMSQLDKKKRRSGSIRLAFRKIFKPKDRPTPSPVASIRPAGRGHEYHKSESALLSPSSRNGLGKVPEERRSPPRHTQKRTEPDDDYLSRTQIDTPRLPFPMNVNAPQPSPYKSNQDRHGEDLTGSPVAHRRRATLPSIVLSPAEAAALTKQLAKGEAQKPNQRDQARTPTPLIGLAITSNNSMSSKRRSRSADALHEMAAQQGLADVRRRSAEIQYWRSTSHGIPEAEEIDEDIQHSQSASIKDVNEIIPPPSLSSSSTTSVSHQSQHLSHHSSQRHEGEAASSITRSVDPIELQDQQPISNEVDTMNRVDQRLSQIELNMAHLAHSMQALTERDVPRAFKLEKAPKGNARAASVDHIRVHGLPSNPRDAMVARATSLKSPNSPKPRHPRPSPSVNDIPVHQTVHEESYSPLSMPKAISHDNVSPLPTQTTAPPFPRTQHQHNHYNHREATATPQTIIHNFSTPYAQSITSTTPQPQQQSSGQQQPSPPQTQQSQQQQQHSPTRIIDQLAPLYNALRYERGERKRLESQVLQLQHDLLDLTTIIAQRLGVPPAAYASPSPDAMMMAQMMRGVKVASEQQQHHHQHQHKHQAGSAGGSLASAEETAEYGIGRNSPGEWAREAREVGNEDWQGDMF